MQLSEHLTLAEFTASDTALRRHIDNSLPPDLMDNALRTARMLEAIRAHLGQACSRDVPIIVTSGFRCRALNSAIGSTMGSDHPRAMAIDFRAPKYGTPRQICAALLRHLDALDIGQMIYEHSWVHCSWRRPIQDNNRVLTLAGSGYQKGIA